MIIGNASALLKPHTGQPALYLPALTGLRALAAYLVFLHHYNLAAPGTFAHALFAQGYIGVSIFFVLSGFLIYHRYADAYLSQKNWSWRRYLLNRFARIYPLYTLLLLLTAGVQTGAGHSMSAGLFMLNLTLLKGFFNSTKFSGIPQSWSLTVEICFYLVAPFLFTGLQRWSVVRLTVSLLGISLLLWTTLGQLVGAGNLAFLLFYTFFGRAFEFVVGMALARRWHQNKFPPIRYTTWIGLFIVIGCIIWQAVLSQFTTQPVYLVVSELVVYNSMLPLGIGLSLWTLIQSKTLVRWLFVQPIMQALGRSSYAFYLVHLGVVANGLQKLGVTNYGLLFGCLLIIAQGLYYFVERPLNKLFCSIEPGVPAPASVLQPINTSPDRPINRK